MANKLKTLELPAERDLVVSTTRWGKQVTVSPVADKGRKEGCLCIHADSKGKTVMCKRLKNNLKLQEALKQTEDHGKKALQNAAEVELSLAVVKTKVGWSMFDELDEDAPCPLALILFELSKMAPAAMGISICGGYIPPDEQAVLTEIVVGNSEKTPPFISKEDVPKLNQDMKMLRERETTSRKKRGK